MGDSYSVVIAPKRHGSPTITKDGVTVAKEIELKDAMENMGACLESSRSPEVNSQLIQEKECLDDKLR